MGLLLAYIVVFLLAATPFFEVVAIIPIGALAGLNTFLVVLIGLCGNIVTVILVIILMEKIKKWIERRRDNKNDETKKDKRGARAEKIWRKYGLPGLAILGPILVGSHLAAFLSMTFGGQKKRVAIWMIGSLTVWATIAGILTFYGVDFYNEQTDNEGFLVEWLKQ
ncbi:small multi-drug export protein [Bacillus solitudinis]|uniref:small multi-drug export protein n=1 Tax=Bacillus solitudinis TaxID=2014074 RepID=UPI000C2413C7|nr:small multi-drug export protein [Bacillus solitudinis]